VKGILILAALVAVVAIGVCAPHGSVDQASAGLSGLKDMGAAAATRLGDMAGTVVRDLAQIPGLTPTLVAEEDEAEGAADEEKKEEEEEVPGIDRVWNVVQYG
jgi:hypothetical protein